MVVAFLVLTLVGFIVVVWIGLIGTVLITFCLFANFGLGVERFIPLEIELWSEAELCRIGVLIGVDFVG